MFFTKPYMENRFVVVVPKYSRIDSISYLAGKTVGFREGGSQFPAFQQLSVFPLIKEPRFFTNNIDVFNALRMGLVDACVLDEGIARYLIKTSRN